MVYLATDADAKAPPDRGRTALTEYFQEAITGAGRTLFRLCKRAGPGSEGLSALSVSMGAGGSGGSEEREIAGPSYQYRESRRRN